MTLLMAVCTACGRETEWDSSLGESPLCLRCWDTDSDAVVSAEERRRQKHRESSRRYRESHKAEIAEQQRRYRESHKAEIRERDRRSKKAGAS